MTSDPNATDTPLDAKKCLGRYAHSWMWVWEGNNMTDNLICQNCGEVKREGQLDGENLPTREV